MRTPLIGLCMGFCAAWLLSGDAHALEASHVSGGMESSAPAIERQRISFTSQNLTLVGFVFKPAGPGPFPALVWNHGSEQNPGEGPQFETVARYFVAAGYVVFAPVRRGHGLSQGQYISARLDAIRHRQGRDVANREMVRLMESEQLADQLAGLSYLKSLAYVDAARLVVAGCSYGGIETLLAAERDVGFKAAIAISPAALSWRDNPELQQRLVQAVGSINIPVLLLQPARDASLEPSRVLGAEFKRLQKEYVGKVFPPLGPADVQGHCFGGARGMYVWAPDALAFLAGVFR